MAQFKGHPPAGKALPNNWQSIAKSNAAQASADYQYQLENAWRGNRSNGTLIQSAQLTGHPQPAPPKRNDARADTRMDGKLTLVSDNEDERIWRDFNGSTIVIKKRK